MADTASMGQWSYHDMSSHQGKQRHELWRGTLVTTPGPTIRHQVILKRLFKLFLMCDMEEERGEFLFGPSDVVLSVNWVVQPDLMFISTDRREIVGYRWIMGAPDLIVEVQSPCVSDRDADFCRLRLEAYAEAGLREYWLVDDDTCSVTIFKLTSEGLIEHGTFIKGDEINSLLLDGLCVPIDKLFRDLPQK
jgi:Uma2 family endonuclease